MKQVNMFIGIVLASLLLANIASAGIELLRDTKIAEVGTGSNKVDVYKIEDTSASTTCYVTRVGKLGAHAISCVR